MITIWHRLDRFLARLRPHREPLSLLIDGAVVAIAWNVNYLFRLGFERWISARPGYDGWVLLAIVLAYAAAFSALKVPQGMWRFSGFGEVKRLAQACLIAGLASAVLVLMLQLTKVPRAVLALHPVVALMGLALVRLGYRMVYEHARAQITGSDREIRRAIVMGAGEAARRLLAGIHQQGWIVLGLLDDDPAKQGARISGLPVLTVPSAAELRDDHGSGQGAIERVRDIEPEDLLGREPVQLDEAGIGAVLAGKTVLVTGAGGSIGSELCRQLARFAPARLVLYELSEFNLYSIEQNLGQRFPQLPLVRVIGDVKDLAHLQHTCGQWRPQVVFHAAAFKHVPLMEEDHIALSALRINTLGTWHTPQAAAEAGAARFVLISIDKAVNPTNVVGATKRTADMVVSMMAADHPGTPFMAVRFGNVLGSGSVIPKFKEQIARGGPVTVTHPDIIRYFMTIPEAARLVLQAAAIGESGQVLVLDMGEPVKIVDLARDLIRLSGHSVDEIPIVFSGLRPGEKLFEELLADGDSTLPTNVSRLRVAQLQDHGGAGRLQVRLVAFGEAAQAGPDAVRAWLLETVPEYAPA